MNRYSEKELRDAVKKSLSFRQVIIALGLKESGGNYRGVQKKCKEYGIDTSHFYGMLWNKAGHESFGNSIDLDERLSLHEKKYPSSKTKEIVLNHGLKENKCEICGITEWNGEPITLQLHHKNGNPKDDRIENLQILCPNCHSQTDNFCKRKELLAEEKSAHLETDEVEPI